MPYKFSEVTPEILKLAERSTDSDRIDPELYTQYDVKRGLRDGADCDEGSGRGGEIVSAVLGRVAALRIFLPEVRRQDGGGKDIINVIKRIKFGNFSFIKVFDSKR